MLNFYNIDENYIKYLQRFDSKVPNIGYSSHNKFVCGIILNINDVDYYAPLSSNKKVFHTSFAIEDGNKVISTIRFSFMFPAPLVVLNRMDFAKLALTDKNYANLLYKEWTYCLSKEQQIINKAKRIYTSGSNPNHPFYNLCCNFAKLEQAAKNYNIE